MIPGLLTLRDVRVATAFARAVRIDRCQGRHASVWIAEARRWECARCGVPLDTRQRGDRAPAWMGGV